MECETHENAREDKWLVAVRFVAQARPEEGERGEHEGNGADVARSCAAVHE